MVQVDMEGALHLVHRDTRAVGATIMGAAAIL